MWGYFVNQDLNHLKSSSAFCLTCCSSACVTAKRCSSAFAVHKLAPAFRRNTVYLISDGGVFTPLSQRKPHLLAMVEGWRQSDGGDKWLPWRLSVQLRAEVVKVDTRWWWNKHAACPCVHAACQVSDLPALDPDWVFKRRATSAWAQCENAQGKLSFRGDVQCEFCASYCQLMPSLSVGLKCLYFKLS